ncbi:OPT oligopeptide transporter family protein [Candida albicans]|uniref:OPT oligopeptide transporter family protein n=1 Tax=Candida albicans TaxID=5476 RepID=A0A8H6C1L4_CANAX|nr:OPT oligopeptide transporter family protein [Candida albicans]
MTIETISNNEGIRQRSASSLVLISNFQFGLQTGWVSMMSLPAALLAFSIFKLLPISIAKNFTDVENVFVQSIAVAVGTGPLCYGFIGIIPAMEKFMTSEESGLGRPLTFGLGQLMIWSLGLGLFGVFFAIPLRKQVIVKEKLPFPSGSATATLISVLHGSDIYQDKEEISEKLDIEEEEGRETGSIATESESLTQQSSKSQLITTTNIQDDYDSNMRSLIITFIISATYTILSFFLPILKKIPIFGNHLSVNYLWNFQPSPAYIGQGIIMGLPTVSYMLFGAILGWGILAPLAKHMEWAPGRIDDWINGGQGWILWISLTTKKRSRSISRIATKSTSEYLLQDQEETRSSTSSNENPENSTYDGKRTQEDCKYTMEVPERHLVSTKTTVIGIAVSTLALHYFFETSVWEHSDLMQDLKTGHLIGASPKAQFIAQILGTLYSVGLSSIMYKVYNSVYKIPSDMFRIPTAVVWIDCSRLVTGQGLPPHIREFALVLGVIFGIISLLKNTVPPTSSYHKYLVYLPSGVAVGVGIYNTPNFTLARFIGGLICYNWQNIGPNGKIGMIIFSSGLVLGEGLLVDSLCF